MPIHRLNHAVLYVRDAERSARFFEEVLAFRRVGAYRFPGAVFLQAPASTNDHDLGLFSVGDQAGDTTAGRGSVGLYHLAWEVDTLGDLVSYRQALSAAGVLVGASDHGATRSLYAKDPDGLEMELAWVVPADRLGPSDRAGTRPLDLDADIARFGIDTPGGYGISRPAPA
ncbi:VOC family protein [Acidiferrimicrobium sp. IK]|uniref:VOC family protein n=1 Tax=Acidiferrimicrobium sp. IK TaxID=2871700 RepID=UPI0021CB17EC|nr:VOC family protein [Acidiferrimicrobium sp. IK]MCU4184473.1 VOC family protein [Acidiferrimicrobium sp. IK]